MERVVSESLGCYSLGVQMYGRVVTPAACGVGMRSSAVVSVVLSRCLVSSPVIPCVMLCNYT